MVNSISIIHRRHCTIMTAKDIMVSYGELSNDSSLLEVFIESDKQEDAQKLSAFLSKTETGKVLFEYPEKGLIVFELVDYDYFGLLRRKIFEFINSKR